MRATRSSTDGKEILHALHVFRHVRKRATETEIHKMDTETEAHKGATETEAHKGATETEVHRGAKETEVHRGAKEPEVHRGTIETEVHKKATETEVHKKATETEDNLELSGGFWSYFSLGVDAPSCGGYWSTASIKSIVCLNLPSDLGSTNMNKDRKVQEIRFEFKGAAESVKRRIDGSPWKQRPPGIIDIRISRHSQANILANRDCAAKRVIPDSSEPRASGTDDNSDAKDKSTEESSNGQERSKASAKFGPTETFKLQHHSLILLAHPSEITLSSYTFHHNLSTNFAT